MWWTLDLRYLDPAFYEGARFLNQLCLFGYVSYQIYVILEYQITNSKHLATVSLWYNVSLSDCWRISWRNIYRMVYKFKPLLTVLQLRITVVSFKPFFVCSYSQKAC